MALDRGLEFGMGEILNPQVQPQAKVAPPLQRAYAGYVAHVAAQPIADDLLASVSSLEPGIERQFKALLTVLVDAGESHQVAGDFSGRVVAAVLPAHLQSRHLQIDDGLRAAGRQTSLEPNELTAPGALHPLLKLLGAAA